MQCIIHGGLSTFGLWHQFLDDPYFQLSPLPPLLRCDKVCLQRGAFIQAARILHSLTHLLVHWSLQLLSGKEHIIV